jgi:hypothetical protein
MAGIQPDIVVEPLPMNRRRAVLDASASVPECRSGQPGTTVI